MGVMVPKDAHDLIWMLETDKDYLEQLIISLKKLEPYVEVNERIISGLSDAFMNQYARHLSYLIERARKRKQQHLTDTEEEYPEWAYRGMPL